MSGLWRHAPQTVRPRSARRTPVLLCLLVFGLTAIVVYRWGHESWIPTNPKPTHTATAYVVERSHKAVTGGRAETGRDHRSRLNEAADVRIPIAYTDDDPRRAEEVANALAERYVHDRRAEWQRRTEGPCLKAREAAETARREHAQNETRLEMFRRQMAEAVTKPQAAVQRQAAAQWQAPAQRQEKPLPPTMIDNPQWLDFDRQLAELQRRHDDLLIDRTPLHPAVQDVAARIEDLQRQMAAIPRQTPDVGSVTQETSEPPPSPNDVASANDQIAKQDRERLDELTAAVEMTRRACRQAEAAEKEALEQQQAGPQYSVVYAQVVEVAPTPDFGWRRLMWTTLVAGVLMAFGVGAVSTGASIEPPVASAGQVRADTNAAVVGTIPADDPVPDPRTLSRRQSRLRRTLIAIGLILIAACPMVAICAYH